MPDLSILIPARNEEWLKRTVEDIFEHAEGDIEVLVGLDGYRDEQFLELLNTYENLRPFTRPHSIGQRATTNRLAELAEGKYLMKVDAHCSFSQGFDTAMLKKMDENTVMIPRTLNLHAYDWVCSCGRREYQGNKPPDCHEWTKEEVWEPKPKPIIDAFYFTKDMICLFDEREKEGDLVETMCVQGSAWMVAKEKYFEWEVGDESFSSWGSQGVEIGCKVWLAGGRIVTNRNAYYAHLFRTEEQFPYQRDMEQVHRNQAHLEDLFLNNKWPKQIHDIDWLFKKFAIHT